MSPRRPLGKDFAPPDRAGGLRAMLPPEPVQGDTSSAQDGSDETLPDVPGDASSSPRQPSKSQSRIDQRPGAGALSLVVVYLSESIYRTLRDRAQSTVRTYTDLALDAVETHLDELPSHWDINPSTGPGKLFTRRQPIRARREEPTRQVQLRLQADAAITLRRLVDECGAPSTTALVDEALRLALTGCSPRRSPNEYP